MSASINVTLVFHCLFDFTDMGQSGHRNCGVHHSVHLASILEATIRVRVLVYNQYLLKLVTIYKVLPMFIRIHSVVTMCFDLLFVLKVIVTIFPYLLYYLLCDIFPVNEHS